MYILKVSTTILTKSHFPFVELLILTLYYKDVEIIILKVSTTHLRIGDLVFNKQQRGKNR
jgi:hypothetical protein